MSPEINETQAAEPQQTSAEYCKIGEVVRTPQECFDLFAKEKLPVCKDIIILGFTKDGLHIEGQSSPQMLAVAAKQLMILALEVQTKQKAAGII
jgi:hypothetical protein